MRGLTQVERVALTEARPVGRTEERIECSASEEIVFEQLVAQGRCVFVDVDDEWGEWVATDLGAIALRVCPPEEA